MKTKLIMGKSILRHIYTWRRLHCEELNLDEWKINFGN